jgi:hypothetical protein
MHILGEFNLTMKLHSQIIEPLQLSEVNINWPHLNLHHTGKQNKTMGRKNITLQHVDQPRLQDTTQL